MKWGKDGSVLLEKRDTHSILSEPLSLIWYAEESVFVRPGNTWGAVRERELWTWNLVVWFAVLALFDLEQVFYFC